MTLVLVHGCGTDHHFWDTLRPHLGDLDVFTPSLPGRDALRGEPALDSAAAAARWLRATLEGRGIDDAVIVGHSYGGAVAIELALLDAASPVPGLRGLVLVATGARLRVIPPILDAVRAAATTGVPTDLARFCYLPSTDPALVERIESAARRTPAASTCADWHATDAFDRLRDVGAIRARTLVVGGTADGLTPPKYAEYLARTIPHAQLERIEGAGHMLPIEHAAELGALLRRFVLA